MVEPLLNFKNHPECLQTIFPRSQPSSVKSEVAGLGGERVRRRWGGVEEPVVLAGTPR